jgi:glycosyltransferase involved in cell wall biosynthesis
MMLLTIAIPTYNRAESLRATLLSFAEQTERLELTDIELIVSDNCSTDTTPEVVAGISAAHPSVRVRYFRNASNLGFDGNVSALFNRAEGRYVWTFSDDDQPAPNALAHVVGLLRQRDIRFAFINYQVCIEGRLLPSRLGLAPDRWLPAPDLLKNIQFSNSLISACLFERQAWLEADPLRYVGSLWIHFFVAREILQAGEGLIVGGALFTMQQSSLEKSRAEKRHEGSDQIEYYMQAHLKFVEYAHELPRFGFDHETCALAHSIGLREDFYQVVNFKLTAQEYAPKQLMRIWSRLRHYRWSSLRFWCVTTPFLFVPNVFIRIMRSVSRAVRT